MAKDSEAQQADVQAAPDSRPQRREKVVLEVGHTHNGKDYDVGDELDVRPDVAKWLRKRGIAK